jgi:GxxExxY protein
MSLVSAPLPAPSSLRHAPVTESILRIFYEVYNELGYGFLEHIYRDAMALAFSNEGVRVQREVPIPVWFRGTKIGEYRADLLVEDVVLVEKAARTLDSAHEAQLLHYLRATEVEVGLLLNFGPRPQFRRLLYDNERKKIRGNP